MKKTRFCLLRNIVLIFFFSIRCMRKYSHVLSLRVCLALISTFFIGVAGWCQRIPVEIYVEQALVSGYDGDEFGPRIRFYYNEWVDDASYALWLSANCIKLSNQQGVFQGIGKTYRKYVSDPEFKIVVVTHEERESGGNDCTFDGSGGIFNKPDRHEAFNTAIINLNDYAPGVYSPTIVITTQTGAAYVETHFRIRYAPISLSPPTGPGGNHCPNVLFTLNTANQYSVFYNTVGLEYEWEYHVSGRSVYNIEYERCIARCIEEFEECSSYNWPECDYVFELCEQNCDDVVGRTIDLWRPLGTTSTPFISFEPLRKISREVSYPPEQLHAEAIFGKQVVKIVDCSVWELLKNMSEPLERIDPVCLAGTQ